MEPTAFLKLGIKVRGLEEVRKGLRAIDKDLSKEMTRIHRGLAVPVAARAKSRAPVRSGRLAGSVRPAAGVKYARVSFGRKLIPYAGPIHFGWPARNITGQPFAVDAINAMAPRMLDDYLKQLTDLVASAIDTSKAVDTDLIAAAA